VADVLREHARTYLAGNGISVDQRRVLRALAVCRTAALGGHLKRCDGCGHEEFFYKSCGNRHCPKCQAKARAQWLEQRAADLLETHYFHVVFTLPQKLCAIALQNKRLIYGLLFRAVSETLLQVAKDRRHLGAQIGFLAVLHTWGQTLGLHPHIHCVVPGGGISPDGESWISSRKKFFVPVKVLSRVFRGKFLDYLRKAYTKGRLSLEGKLVWEANLKSLRRNDWVVYSKPPFGSAKRVLKYLARYTHRVAISNERLLSVKDGKVTFRYKDYARGNSQREMTLCAHEFIRRFLLHVLPGGFQRIRQYGLLANRVREEKLTLCRRLLRERPGSEAPASEAAAPLHAESDRSVDSSSEVCPACKQGRLVHVGELTPDAELAETLFPSQIFDTS
jgi:hypothetical protein